MRYADSEGARIHYRIEGNPNKPPLLFSNSLGTDLSSWDEQVDSFAEHFLVVRYDGRGQGSSDSPAPPYTIDRLGGDLIAVLDDAEIESAHICGISLGGLVAMWVAAHHAERVQRMVCACTAARIGTSQTWDERIHAVRQGGMAAVADFVMARLLTEQYRRTSPESASRLRAMLTDADPNGYIGCCLALRDADLRGTVGAIAGPTLVIAGNRDEATPIEDAEWLHAAIPVSELVVLDGAAHLANVEDADNFNAAAFDFLTR